MNYKRCGVVPQQNYAKPMKYNENLVVTFLNEWNTKKSESSRFISNQIQREPSRTNKNIKIVKWRLSTSIPTNRLGVMRSGHLKLFEALSSNSWALSSISLADDSSYFLIHMILHMLILTFTHMAISVLHWFLICLVILLISFSAVHSPLFALLSSLLLCLLSRMPTNKYNNAMEGRRPFD